MRRYLKVLLMADTWATFALGMIGPIYAIFVQDIGGDIMDASWAYFWFMISSGVVMFLLGLAEDRFKRKERFITLGYALFAVGCLSYYFVSDQIMLIVTQIILGFALAILVPAYDALYSRYIEKKKAASQWALWEAMQRTVTAASAVVGGAIATWLGFRVLFIAMFLVAMISVITSFWLWHEENSDPGRILDIQE